MKMNLVDRFQEIIRLTARKMQLDTDRSFLLEMNSEGKLRITGITDIKTYEEGCIILLSSKYVTEIRGKGLFTGRFSDTEVSVSGEIDKIEFIKR